jgi:hypothetical protein
MNAALTTIGSLAGLATGIFTVWDRWARWRPVAYAVAKTKDGGSYIRIKNLGPMDIIIQRIKSRPSAVKVAKGNSLTDFLHGAIDELEPTAIAPQETHDFFFWERRDVDAPRTRTVLFLVYWRKASSTWLPQIPIVISAHQTADD